MGHLCIGLCTFYSKAYIEHSVIGKQIPCICLTEIAEVIITWISLHRPAVQRDPQLKHSCEYIHLATGASVNLK